MTEKKPKKPSPKLLIISLIGFSLLLMLIFDLANTYVKESYTRSERSIEKQIKIKDYIVEMYEASRARTFIILDMARYTDGFKLDEMNQELAKEAQKFIKAREQLRRLRLTNSERDKLIDKLSIVAANAIKVQKVADLFIEQKRIAGVNYLLAEAIPAQNKALLSIQSLIKDFEISIRFKLISIEARNAEINKKFEIFIISFVLVSVFLFAGFIVYLWRKEAQTYAKHILHETKAKQKLSYEQSHDALTGLINSAEYENRLLELLQRSHSHEEHAVLLIEIEQLAKIKKHFGKQASDLLLIKMAKIINQCIRSSDLLAHIHEDQFSVILTACNMAQVKSIAEKIITTVNTEGFTWHNKPISITLSIGITQINDKHTALDFTTIIEATKKACLKAKKMKGNQFYLINEQIK